MWKLTDRETGEPVFTVTPGEADYAEWMADPAVEGAGLMTQTYTLVHRCLTGAGLFTGTVDQLAGAYNLELLQEEDS